MIEPTVGRVVWFFEPVSQDPKHPMAAIVTWVHGPRCVNLVAFTPNGHPIQRTSVPLVQGDGSDGPVDGCWAEWMPFQKGQAARTEKAEAQLAAGSK